MQDMKNLDQKFLEKLKSKQDILGLEENASRTVSDDVWQSKGNFEYKGMKFNYGITRSDLMNFYYFSFGFNFTFKKEMPKMKCLEIVNSFNEDRPSIKAVLSTKKNKKFSIVFSQEIASLENESIVDLIYPALNILATSPALFYFDAEKAGAAIIPPMEMAE
ncbi:TPA: hypothetical protein ACVS3C_002660 [Enterobacter hormaechei]|uniref:hypothetical protein n=1 Tax=Enterobacter cloacae complex TaxID=354276 RepID=UPI0005F8A045|nr:hypothetical protein [Enterobacter hormaechei]EHN8837946.1 hypothetical protein [Enterobacter hormaechei]EKS6330287.1 hypothetical protein [Enterobacter hormaechei]EKS6510083.1 hypothetical protein [Enterobacter hormaechei]EKT4032650.1 hypothetical protein [Enterobacter hormaechei]EKZ1442135.1 hypothetical protein [Enterobacter hormaechei]